MPVFLIANPDESGGGGGANGGRLVVEVPSPDPVSFLVHEILHVVLASDAATIREAAASAGISGQTLNEAIAYAFAPGLTGEADRDLLAEGLAGYVIRGTPATDPYVQYYTMATAICPLLRVSIDEGESRCVKASHSDNWSTMWNTCAVGESETARTTLPRSSSTVSAQVGEAAPMAATRKSARMGGA